MAENMVKLVGRIDRVLARRRYEVIIVDDKSVDGTAEVAEELAGWYPVRVVKRPRRLGLLVLWWRGLGLHSLTSWRL